MGFTKFTEKQELNPNPADAKLNSQVFDLLFTKDSRSLLTGHGNGKILVWKRSTNNDFDPDYKLIIDLQKQLNKSYQIKALALSPDENTLVAAGSYRDFVIISNWNTKSPHILEQKACVDKSDDKDARENNYIFSIAFAPRYPNLLATSDSFGFIKIWDLTQDLPVATSKQQKEQTQENCAKPVSSWLASDQNVSVNSISFIDFDQDGSQLVSAGDDGRIMLWYLTPKGMLNEHLERKEIDQSSHKGKGNFGY